MSLVLASKDSTLSAALTQHGLETYSMVDNVHGFEKYLTQSNSVTQEEIFEGMDRARFQDPNAWYTYADYCHLMSNVVKYQRHMRTHYEYGAIGRHVILNTNSLRYRALALLPLATVFNEATKVSNRVQKAYHVEVHQHMVNGVKFSIKDSAAFSAISFGSECRYFTGALSAFLQLNGIARYHMDHILCGKSLRQLVLRQYGSENFIYAEDEDGVFINGELLAQEIGRREMILAAPGFPIPESERKAYRIVRNFHWKGRILFREGEIYDAPCCAIRLSYVPIRFWQRLSTFLWPVKRDDSLD